MGATEANLESVASILPVGGLKPEHFTGYMKPLVETRKLGRTPGKRVRTYLIRFLLALPVLVMVGTSCRTPAPIGLPPATRILTPCPALHVAALG